VLLALACGCSSASDKAPNPRPVTTTTKTTVARTTTSTVPVRSTTSIPVAGPTLRSLIPTEVPSGFPRKPDSAADTGPTDLKKAAADDVLSSDPRQALVNARFLRGYQRQWAAEGGAANIVTAAQNFLFLYQFATPEGASSYVTHWRTAILAQNTGPTPVSFSPLNIPGAIGLRASDVDGSSGVVLFAKGPYAVEALVTGRANIDQSLAASALALAQYVRLP
jgi:hypothetical protein